MAEGVEAVETEIMHEFHPSDILHNYDPEVMASVLSFEAEGRVFVVRVSQEFDDDYASGQVNVDLTQLGPILRASKDGRATVRRSGIL